MGVIYNYSDYNPSYSHPGMPMSTPTSFQDFVVPRPPRGIDWPQPQSTPMTQGGRGQRPTPFQSQSQPQTFQPPEYNPTSFPMMGMTDPSGWGEPPGMNQPAPYPQNQNWSQGAPRQIRIPQQNYNQQPYYTPPTSSPRQQYMSPWQREIQGAYDFIPERLRRFLGLDI